MKITVINGTEIRGCTYGIKELFLDTLGRGNEIKEYYLPKDCPVFCTGCKSCFFKDISVESDLIVITSPAYVFGPTAQIKALLDHYGTKWMAHSPEKPFFKKQAVILTNAIGAGMGNVIKVIGSSLDFWGIAKRYVVKQALFESEWKLIDEKRKNNIKAQCEKVCGKISANGSEVVPRTKIRVLFYLMRFAQKMIHKAQLKAGHEETKDHKYWSEQGWLDGGKPWN